VGFVRRQGGERIRVKPSESGMRRAERINRARVQTSSSESGTEGMGSVLSLGF
jgi:hypothetical protein